VRSDKSAEGFLPGVFPQRFCQSRTALRTITIL
jgi:hypothetical protein